MLPCYRDILVAGLLVPAALDSEIIHMTWNLGLEYCISYRSVPAIHQLFLQVLNVKHLKPLMETVSVFQFVLNTKKFWMAMIIYC